MLGRLCQDSLDNNSNIIVVVVSYPISVPVLCCMHSYRELITQYKFPHTLYPCLSPTCYTPHPEEVKQAFQHKIVTF